MLGIVLVQLLGPGEGHFREEVEIAIDLGPRVNNGLDVIGWMTVMLTSWCARAALLQNAVVTATEVSSPTAIFWTRSMAERPVICFSSSVSRLLAWTKSMADPASSGTWTRHSGGMDSSMRAFSFAAVSCQVMLAVVNW